MKEFVEVFKEKRKELGLTLSEVSEKTNVRKKYLKAIEEGDFEEANSEVSLKGFIKIYANFLSLDTEEILSKYEAYKQKVLDETDEIEEKTLNEKLGKYLADSRDGFLAKGIIIVISVLILAVAGFYVYENLFLNNELEEDEAIEIEEEDITDEEDELMDIEEDIAEEEDESLETEEEDITEEEDEVMETEEDVDLEENEAIETEEDVDLEELEEGEFESETEEIASNEDGEIEIEIVTLEETWYSVTVDQETVFEDFTEEGDINLFQGSEIDLVIGNAAGVEIIKEDEVLGPFGETGEVVHKEYIIEEND